MGDAEATPVPKPKQRGYVTPQKGQPLSASAAKRRSVVALGSIQHLQHYYAKQAHTARAQAPHALAKPLPATGRDMPEDLMAEGIAEEPENLEDFPPTPSPPPARLVQPYEDVEKEDVPSIEDVWQQVEDVCKRWALVTNLQTLSRVNSPAVGPAMTPSLSADSFNSSRSTSPVPPASPKSPIIEDKGLVLALLTATTSAIRMVQRYVLALPPTDENDPEKLANGMNSLALGDSPLTVRHQSQLAVSTAARPRTSSTVANKPRKSALPVLQRTGLPAPPEKPRDDPLAALRRASMTVLTALNDMEGAPKPQSTWYLAQKRTARYRLPTEDGKLSPSVSRTGAKMLDGSDNLDVAEKSPPLLQEGFGTEGYLYQENVTLDDLTIESSAVTEWVETADRVLTQCSHLDTRAPSSTSNRSFYSTKRNWPTTLRYTENPLGLVYIVLASFLPPTLLVRLASPTAPSGDRMAFLESLSDGQILATAYNSALRASQKPFGFIPTSSIQDCEAVSATVGKTFRRFENLRVLSAALKLRYGLSLGEVTLREKARSAPPVDDAAQRKAFDARVVARKDPGWDEQLETLVLEWAECVVAEHTSNEEQTTY